MHHTHSGGPNVFHNGGRGLSSSQLQLQQQQPQPQQHVLDLPAGVQGSPVKSSKPSVRPHRGQQDAAKVGNVVFVDSVNNTPPHLLHNSGGGPGGPGETHNSTSTPSGGLNSGVGDVAVAGDCAGEAGSQGVRFGEGDGLVLEINGGSAGYALSPLEPRSGLGRMGRTPTMHALLESSPSD